LLERINFGYAIAATTLVLTLSAVAQYPSTSRNTQTRRASRSDSPVQFVDVTSSLGIDFVHQASPTTQKYLVETMGAGVALFDCDGDVSTFSS
jgi:hypothetical protein